MGAGRGRKRKYVRVWVRMREGRTLVRKAKEYS
jgi:hypothetical protein